MLAAAPPPPAWPRGAASPPALHLGGAPPACVPSHRPAASPSMCDKHVFTAWSSQAMPESGVKATVGSLSLCASGLLSAVSRFFPLLCPFCSAVFVWKPSPPHACVSRSLLGQRLPLPPHSGPGPHSPCSAPTRSPTCSPRICFHLPWPPPAPSCATGLPPGDQAERKAREEGKP